MKLVDSKRRSSVDEGKRTRLPTLARLASTHTLHDSKRCLSVEGATEGRRLSDLYRLDINEFKQMFKDLEALLVGELNVIKGELAALNVKQSQVQMPTSENGEESKILSALNLKQVQSLTKSFSGSHDWKGGMTHRSSSVLRSSHSSIAVPEHGLSIGDQSAILLAKQSRTSCGTVERFLAGRYRPERAYASEGPSFQSLPDEAFSELQEVNVADLSPRFVVAVRAGPRMLSAQQAPEPTMTEDAAFDKSDERMSLLDVHLRKTYAQQGLRSSLIRLVTNRNFENAVGLMLFVNAVVLGIETDIEAKKVFGHLPPDDGAAWWQVRCFELCETLFCTVFTVELLLRLCAYHWSFFTMSDSSWNIFDLIICVVWVTEQGTGTFHNMLGLPQNPSSLRLLRLLRVVRITRLIRIVRSVEQLRTIVASIMASMTSLFWTVTLLTMLIYMVSVLFTQVVLTSERHDSNEELRYWFGSVGRTCLTMFEVIAGGVSWDAVIHPVMEHVSPAMGVVFVLYVVFSVFAMTNIITGIFVESAMSKASEDKDRYTANHIRDLFFNDPEVEVDQTVTWETFHDKMNSPDMKDYFKAINVDPSEARGLFRLFDSDSSGSVDAEELVSGCLRLRGAAKALDLSLLMYETSLLHDSVMDQTDKIDFLLASKFPTTSVV